MDFEEAKPVVQTTVKKPHYWIYLLLVVIVLLLGINALYILRDNPAIRAMIARTPLRTYVLPENTYRLPYDINDPAISDGGMYYIFKGQVTSVKPKEDNSTEITLDKPDLPPIIILPGSTRLYTWDQQTKKAILIRNSDIKTGDLARVLVELNFKKKIWNTRIVSIVPSEATGSASQ